MIRVRRSSTEASRPDDVSRLEERDLSEIVTACSSRPSIAEGVTLR